MAAGVPGEVVVRPVDPDSRFAEGSVQGTVYI